MNTFDERAREWDKDKMHMDRSVAIAAELDKMIPLKATMNALEYGAGTGMLSFLLKDHFAEITLMDSSQEMIKVCEEKVEYHHAKHIKPIWFDLEQTDYPGNFDIIFNQMVLHHVNNVEAIQKKFYSLLNPDGYLAIADLYSEDGSFHGPGVNVHLGFDPDELAKSLKNVGFRKTNYKIAFTITRDDGMEYPVFLLVAQK